MVKIAPGTCESCPSWCWKGNWRGAASFLRPDGQMGVFFLRFEEGEKRGRKTQPPFFCGGFCCLVDWYKVKNHIPKMKSRSSRHETPRIQRSIISIWSFKTSPAIYIRRTTTKIKNPWRSCWKLREVSKLLSETNRQVMAPYSADYPKVIIHPTDTCKFRLELCDEQDDVSPFFFWKTKQTTRKKKEHEENQSKPKIGRVATIQNIFFGWVWFLFPKQHVCFWSPKSFPWMKKETNPSRKVSNLSWSVKMTKKKTMTYLNEEKDVAGNIFVFFLGRVGKSSKLLY